MKTDKLRNKINNYINKEANEKFLRTVEALINIEEKELDKDWWNNISEEERIEIEKGISQANKGELIPHEEVMKKYKKWLTK